MIGLPNALTIMRILLVPVFAIAFVMPGEVSRIVAFLVFVVASISDWLEGFAADVARGRPTAVTLRMTCAAELVSPPATRTPVSAIPA